MIIPNVTQHSPVSKMPSGNGPSGTDAPGQPTTSTPTSSGNTSTTTMAPAGSANTFGELSGLVQQFLLRLQDGFGNGGMTASPASQNPSASDNETNDTMLGRIADAMRAYTTNRSGTDLATG
jgi:hypothetical protein